jgi:thiol-disulfide isomerase/thioredoxin
MLTLMILKYKKSLVVIFVVYLAIVFGSVFSIYFKKTYYQPDQSLVPNGRYVIFNKEHLPRYKNNPIVFFEADWCVSCKFINQDIIQKSDQIPADLQVLKVEYKGSLELRKAYKVNIFPLMMIVDKQGKELKRTNAVFNFEQMLDFANQNTDLIYKN